MFEKHKERLNRIYSELDMRSQNKFGMISKNQKIFRDREKYIMYNRQFEENSKFYVYSLKYSEMSRYF